MTAGSEVRRTKGNVFADIGLPEPETALAKAELARRINSIIKERGLRQTDAAKLLGIDQAKVSALSCGRLAGFSTDRLFRFLNTLDRDVEIVIRAKPSSRRRAHISISAP